MIVEDDSRNADICFVFNLSFAEIHY